MSTSERRGRALTLSDAAASALLDKPIKAIDPRCVSLQGHALNDLDAAHEAREQQDAGERNDRRKSGDGEVRACGAGLAVVRHRDKLTRRATTSGAAARDCIATSRNA